MAARRPLSSNGAGPRQGRRPVSIRQHPCAFVMISGGAMMTEATECDGTGRRRTGGDAGKGMGGSSRTAKADGTYTMKKEKKQGQGRNRPAVGRSSPPAPKPAGPAPAAQNRRLLGKHYANRYGKRRG
jgi:hypothetical protein